MRKELLSSADYRARGASLSVGTILSPGMDNMGKGKISLPNDYQYDNAKPGESWKRTPFSEWL